MSPEDFGPAATSCRRQLEPERMTHFLLHAVCRFHTSRPFAVEQAALLMRFSLGGSTAAPSGDFFSSPRLHAARHLHRKPPRTPNGFRRVDRMRCFLLVECGLKFPVRRRGPAGMLVSPRGLNWRF